MARGSRRQEHQRSPRTGRNTATPGREGSMQREAQSSSSSNNNISTTARSARVLSSSTTERSAINTPRRTTTERSSGAAVRGSTVSTPMEGTRGRSGIPTPSSSNIQSPTSTMSSSQLRAASRRATTPSERPNQGSGSHQQQQKSHSSRSDDPNATNRSTFTTPDRSRTNRSSRPNHGGSTHHHHAVSPSGSRSTRNGGIPTAASSTRPSSTTRTTNFPTTGTRNQQEERPNQGSGTHRHHGRSTPYPSSRQSWWSSRHRQIDPTSRRSHNDNHRYTQNHDGDEQLNDGDNSRCGLFGYICACLSTLLGIMFCCCRQGRITNERDTETTTLHSISQREREGKRTTVCPMIVGLVLSILTFVCLMSISAFDDDNVWTLFAGETRRVYLPRLVRAVHVTVVSGTDPTVEAAVFRLGNTCPPLTGPPVTLAHDSELDLIGGSYQYDYYNLSPGSTVRVRFTQLAGSTYFYLLKGLDALHEIQSGTYIDPNHWEDIAIMKRHVTPSSRPSDTAILYKQNSHDNDIYTLVYDNGSTERDSSVDVESDIVLTTYNLAGSIPKCDNMHWAGYNGGGDSCDIFATRSDCVILESFSIGENGGSDGSGVISLRIDVSREWKMIWILSTTPLVLSILLCVVHFLQHYCCGSTPNAMDAEDDDDAAEPLLDHNDMERPPPTAPHGEESINVQPSAPHEEASLPIIVIPPEQVSVQPTSESTRWK